MPFELKHTFAKALALPGTLIKIIDMGYGHWFFNKIVFKLNLQSPHLPACSKQHIFLCLDTVSVCQSSDLYEYTFYFQDVFNLLPNLNVADLIKAFAGKGIKSANFYMFYHFQSWLLSDFHYVQ